MSAFAHVPSPVDKVQLGVMRDELEDVRGDINSVIGQIETVREDLHQKRCDTLLLPCSDSTDMHNAQE